MFLFSMYPNCCGMKDFLQGGDYLSELLEWQVNFCIKHACFRVYEIVETQA